MDKKIQGKKNRASGATFERKVRKDLESKDWVVSKWMNNVSIDNNTLIPAKHKFRGPGIPMSIGTGFPDFIAFRTECTLKCRKKDLECHEPCKEQNWERYEIIGVEVKSNGYLTKEEKEKCKWLLDNNIFSKILIASKSKIRGEIIYKSYKEFYDENKN